MFNKLALMSIFGSYGISESIQLTKDDRREFQNNQIKKGKGQLRQAKPKPSGAAALKRAAKKRKNIRNRKS